MNWDYSRAFSSMCTCPHPVAVKAHMSYLHTNLGDPNLFPELATCERRAIALLGSFLGCDAAVGYITTGGTESNIQAVRASKFIHNRKMPNIIVPASAHQSFDKARDFMGVEVKRATLDDGYAVDPSSVESLIDEHTVCVVGIAGTTSLGVIDPIVALANLAQQNDLFLHVDAAFGGFVIPFLRKHYAFDFKVDGVRSLTIDPHKMGMSTIPSGGLLFKAEDDFDTLSINTFYSVERSMTGTRSGASAAATLAVLEHLGYEGYKKVVTECMRLTDLCVESAAEFKVYPVIEPLMNVVALRVPRLQQVALKLTARRWHVSIMNNALRLVIMPHITERMLLEFMGDLEQIVTTYDR